MNGFYVDPAGMDGLYNLFVRASSDAEDTLRYTSQHCNMRIEQQGLISHFAGPHEVAYGQVTKSLEQLQKLTRSAGTQINLAQLEYTASDVSAAAHLDQTFPGARNPAGLRGSLATGRTDLWPVPPRSPFADVADPTKRLAAPNYASALEMWTINPMTDLVSPAAWLRQVSVWVFGHDPFEDWTKQFSGDWDSYVHCAAAWPIIGRALHDIGRNLTAPAADVPTVWRGQAAEAEQEFQVELGRAAMALHPICDRYSELYHQAAEATKDLFVLVSGLITKLLDVLIVVNLAAAVGTATIETGVGAVAGYAVAAYYAWQAYDLYKEISTFFANAEIVVKGLAGTVAMVGAGATTPALPEIPPYQHPGQQG